MDVTCQQCHTEYEFDETLVSGRGTTVKCTNCGHLFKVRRSHTPLNSNESRVSWRVRGRDLSMRQVHSLRELQELITDGQLTEDDEISRSGAAFKRLGTIGELRPFFLAAQHLDAAPASRRGDRPTPTPHVVQEQRRAMDAQRPKPADAREDPEHLRTVAAPARSQSLANRTRPLSERPLQRPVQERGKGTVLGLGQRPSRGPVLQIADPGTTSPTRAAPSTTTARRSPAGKQTTLGLGRQAQPGTTGTGTLPRRPIDTIPDESFEVQPTQAQAPTQGPDPEGGAFSGARNETARRGRSVSPEASRPQHRGPRRPAAAPQGITPAIPHEGGDSFPIASEKGGGLGRPQERLSAERRSLYVDEGDLTRAPQRDALGPGSWIGGILLGAVVCAATFWFVRGLEPAPTGPDDAALEQSRLALQQGELSAILAAIEQHPEATASDAPTLQVMASLHAGAAQIYTFQARDWVALQRRRDGSPSETGRDALRRARTHGEQALTYAKRSADLEPDTPEGLLALANAYRLSGDLEKAEITLGKANLRAPDGSAEASYIKALLAMDQHGGEEQFARPGALLSIQQDPKHLRARLLLVRSELATRDVAAAQKHLATLLATPGNHPRARALLRAIDTGTPPAPEVLTVDEAPPEAETQTPTADDGADEVSGKPTPQLPAAASRRRAEPPTRPSAAQASGPAGDAPRCRSSDCWTSLGATAQARGDRSRAQHYFEQALQLDPSDPEANAGLGKAYLAAGNLSAAVGLLRAAARANYSDSALVLGAALRRAGRVQEARDAYQRYLDRNPGGRYAAAAERALESLNPSTSTPPRETDETEAPASPDPPDTNESRGSTVDAESNTPPGQDGRYRLPSAPAPTTEGGAAAPSSPPQEEEEEEGAPP